MKEFYSIVAEPMAAQVVRDQTMSFSLLANDRRLPAPDKVDPQWRCENDKAVGGGADGPNAQRWADALWTKIGRHRVVCGYKLYGGYFEAELTVEVLETVLTVNPDLHVEADPPVQTVVPDQRMSFTLMHRDGDASAIAMSPRWFCINDPDADESWRGSLAPGPDGTIWRDARWTKIGHHRVICRVQYEDGLLVDVECPISVVSLETIADRAPMVSAMPMEPGVVLQAKRDEQAVIDVMAARHPAPADRAEAFAARDEQRREYIARLAEMLTTSATHRRVPVRGMYYASTNQHVGGTQWMTLNLFLFEGDDDWHLVDWTNPTAERTCGTYTGATPGEAVHDFDLDNRYPTGIIKLDLVTSGNVPVLPAPVNNGALASRGNVRSREVEFDTDGESRLDTLAKVLDWIATAGAVVVGVATLIAPIPGSRVLSAVIWTSIFASTASATIKIGQRGAAGFSNFRDDAFDALTIASNLFAAGAMAQVWRRGAMLTINAGRGVQRMVIVGQFATDGVQGVLIAAESLQEFEQVSNDTTLAPDERLTKLVALVGRLVLDGALVTINVRGTKADLDNMTAQNRYLAPEQTPKQRLEQLADENATIDTTKPRGVEGETSQVEHGTRAQTTHAKVLRKPLSRAQALDLLVQQEKRALAKYLAKPRKTRGPAFATVVDPVTGRVFHGTNSAAKRKPEPLHQVLAARIKRYENDASLQAKRETYSDGVPKNGTIGHHAEVYALNEALLARQQLGMKVDDSTISELLVSVRRSKTYRGTSGNSGGDAGDIFIRCPDCRIVTESIQTVPELTKAEADTGGGG